MVTDEGKGPAKPLPSYSEQFEKVCGWYLSIGMSYSDYWDGDPEIAKYFREKYRCDMERRNTELWLQGAYIYEAIMDAMPAFNFFSKKRKPIPYRDEPMPLTGQEKKSSEDRKADKRMDAGKKFLESWAAAVNANRKKKKEQTNGS